MLTFHPGLLRVTFTVPFTACTGAVTLTLVPDNAMIVAETEPKKTVRLFLFGGNCCP